MQDLPSFHGTYTLIFKNAILYVKNYEKNLQLHDNKFINIDHLIGSFDALITISYIDLLFSIMFVYFYFMEVF